MDASSPLDLPLPLDHTWKPLDLHGLQTYELKSRPSKVFQEDLGRPVHAGASIGEWIESLPRQLAGAECVLPRIACFTRRTSASCPVQVKAEKNHLDQSCRWRAQTHQQDWPDIRRHQRNHQTRQNRADRNWQLRPKAHRHSQGVFLKIQRQVFRVLDALLYFY